MAKPLFILSLKSLRPLQAPGGTRGRAERRLHIKVGKAVSHPSRFSVITRSRLLVLLAMLWSASTTSLLVPPVRNPGTIHIILEVRDSGTPKLWAYRRAMVKIKQ